jgi:hypothetical protein
MYFVSAFEVIAYLADIFTNWTRKVGNEPLLLFAQFWNRKTYIELITCITLSWARSVAVLFVTFALRLLLYPASLWVKLEKK